MFVKIREQATVWEPLQDTELAETMGTLVNVEYTPKVEATATYERAIIRMIPAISISMVRPKPFGLPVLPCNIKAVPPIIPAPPPGRPNRRSRGAKSSGPDHK